MWRSSTTHKRSSSSQGASDEPGLVPHNARPSTQRRTTSTSRSTLSEALKGSPFRPAREANLLEPNPEPPIDDDPVVSLNRDLNVFASIYPDVQLEVLRELLLRFDGESRLQICTEQLIKFKSEWTRGRLLNPPRDTESIVTLEDSFRSRSYINASKRTLYAEFKGLSKSAVDAVLAEVNQSYSKARPVLQAIAAKTWRATFSAFFKRKKTADDIPSSLVEKIGAEYVLHNTGDDELDEELEQLFFTDRRHQRRVLQEQKDVEFATAINQQEAEEAEALFECQVCYDDVPFEFITTCTGNAHTICRNCVKRTLQEAIFGQGWAQSVDVSYGSLRCIAMNGHDPCPDHISQNLLQNTILSAESGRETWNKFEQRLAADNLMKSDLSLTHCAFCQYAEATQMFTLATAPSIRWRLRKQQTTMSLILLFMLAEIILPTLLLIGLLSTIVHPGLIQQLFYTSLINSHRLGQTHRFRCRNPTCLRTSCLSCSKPWHDPHTCHEPLILSLRTAVEAARTAALKRTCPRCGMSFVKSSGCNKLTCVCGYAMCYICRKNIGKVNDGGAVDEREGGEGYRHFCEHFRPSPGQKCTECTKCDLYMTEDEEALVKKAGEEAERIWREKEGMIGVKGLGLEEAVVSLGKVRSNGTLARAWEKFVTSDWTIQEVCDWAVSSLIIVEN